MRHPTSIRHICLFIAASFAPLATASLPLGQLAPELELKGESGSTINEEAWSSKSLTGKVHMLVYSTVGAKDLNNETTEAIKKAEFSKDAFASIAVINMKSSWQPNFMINRALTAKQKEYPNTLYVRDLQNVLVKQWSLADHSNDLVLFDKTGRVVFSVDGELKKEQREELLKLIGEKIKN